MPIFSSGAAMTQGQVQSFNSNRGYGFIKLSENNQVAFAHQRDVQGDYKPLSKGEIVAFDVKEVPQGLDCV